MNTPMANVRALSEEISSLTADESLHAVTVAQVGTGWADQKSARRVIDGWRRASGIGPPAGATAAEMRDFATSIGALR